MRVSNPHDEYIRESDNFNIVHVTKITISCNRPYNEAQVLPVSDTYPDPGPAHIYHRALSGCETRNHDHAYSEMTGKAGLENDRDVCCLPDDPKGSV